MKIYFFINIIENLLKKYKLNYKRINNMINLIKKIYLFFINLYKVM